MYLLDKYDMKFRTLYIGWPYIAVWFLKLCEYNLRDFWWYSTQRICGKCYECFLFVYLRWTPIIYTYMKIRFITYNKYIYIFFYCILITCITMFICILFSKLVKFTNMKYIIFGNFKQFNRQKTDLNKKTLIFMSIVH